MNVSVEMSWWNVIRLIALGMLIGTLLMHFFVMQPVFDEWGETIDALGLAYSALEQCASLCAAQGLQFNCTIVPDEMEGVDL